MAVEEVVVVVQRSRAISCNCLQTTMTMERATGRQTDSVDFVEEGVEQVARQVRVGFITFDLCAQRTGSNERSHH